MTYQSGKEGVLEIGKNCIIWLVAGRLQVRLLLHAL